MALLCSECFAFLKAAVPDSFLTIVRLLASEARSLRARGSAWSSEHSNPTSVAIPEQDLQVLASKSFVAPRLELSVPA